MNSELARRIAFTLGALLVFRLGTYVPLPGVNVIDARLSIFSLGILPYLSVAILIQLGSMVSSKLSGLARGGETGRRKIARWTVGVTMFLTAFQAFGIASKLQDIPNLVSDPGGLFVLSTTVTLTGGTIFLIWLSEQITARGIGNGLARILFASVAAGMPRAVAKVLELGRRGVVSSGGILLLAILCVGLVGLVVFVELARRRVPVEFSARKLGNRSLPAQSTYLSLKLNSAGLIPTVVATWLLFLPLSLAGAVFGSTSPWLTTAYGWIQPGHLGHMVLSSIAIIILAFVYTAYVTDPENATASLARFGGVVPGIEPGEATAEHLDGVVSYVTCIGAVYLAVLFLIPEVLVAYLKVPFILGGTSVLIVVCTVLDIKAQVRGQSLSEPGGEQG
jgi:preprotein translocase subunit SecY